MEYADSFEFTSDFSLEPQGIIAILIALMEAGKDPSLVMDDGSVRFVTDGSGALTFQTASGSLTLVDAGDGYSEKVAGDPWPDITTALLPYIEQENLFDADTSAVVIDPGAVLKLSDVNIDAGAAQTIIYNEFIPAVAAGDVNGDGVDDVIVGFASSGDGGTFAFTPYAGFTGGVRVAAGDITGDGSDDVIVGLSDGARFVFADGSVRFIRDGESVEFSAVDGGGIFNDGLGAAFEDLAGSEEVYFAGPQDDPFFYDGVF